MHSNFIDTIITPNFTPIATCSMVDDARWCFTKDPSYHPSKDTSSWVYAFLVEFNGARKVVEVGSASNARGMSRRMATYQSGNPARNNTNRPKHRDGYLKIAELLLSGAEVYVMGRSIPHVEVVVQLDMPWSNSGPTPHSLDARIHKQLKKTLIAKFAAMVGQKPEW